MYNYTNNNCSSQELTFISWPKSSEEKVTLILQRIAEKDVNLRIHNKNELQKQLVKQQLNECH
jgi:hypothetical protein